MSSHIITPSKPILIEKISEHSASYSIEPLNPGYGVTIANSLRRVMLSSLQGCAVQYFKIKGVPHEFTTIPNILEDAVEISLNIKALRFAIVGENTVTLSLKVGGERKVTGADVQVPAGVEVLNKDLHLFTITDQSTSIEAELVVAKGFGYVKAEDQEINNEVGLLAVDSAFSPVIRVNYEIEDMRVGDRTNYNRAIFHITTDGSISPLEALQQSAAILVEQFQSLYTEDTVEQPNIIENEPKELETSSISIEVLDLGQRISKVLISHDIQNVAQILQFSKEDLLAKKGITEKALEKISAKLSEHGIEY
jgi:DNA-directed RNA polymerase subunit alpha